jgi:hypothetical protein
LKVDFFKNQNRRYIMSEKWKLSGIYFEACSCDIVCPCTFLSAPTTGECTALVGWHIENGNFSNTSLNGLNVALALYAPGHMLEVKWKVAVYVDETANESQKDALTKIFTGQVGGHPAMLASFVGEVLGIKSAPIEFEAIGRQRKLKIGEVAELEVESVKKKGGADVSITNPPMGLAPGFPIVVAKSQKFSYKDHGLQWEISNKNGFYSPFAYEGN